MLLLGILNTSAFSDAQKSFAGSVVLLILVLLYTEATYERKATKRDVKGKKSKAVDEGDNHDE